VRQGESNGDQGRHLERNRISGERIAYDVYVASRESKKALFGGCAQNGQIAGLDAYEPRTDHFEGKGILRGEKISEGASSSTDRPRSVHRHDAVNNGQSRVEKVVNVYEQSAELFDGAALAEVPKGFALATNATKDVLDRKSCKQLPMGFELGQVDDDIGVEGEGADTDFAACVRKAAGDGSVQLAKRNAEVLERLNQVQGFCAGVGIGPGGGVGNDGASAEVLEQTCGLDDDGGVGLGGVPMGAWGDEVRFKQDGVARLDEGLEVSEQLELASKGGCDSARTVFGTVYQRDSWTFWLGHHDTLTAVQTSRMKRTAALGSARTVSSVKNRTGWGRLKNSPGSMVVSVRYF